MKDRTPMTHAQSIARAWLDDGYRAGYLLPVVRRFFLRLLRWRQPEPSPATKRLAGVLTPVRRRRR